MKQDNINDLFEMLNNTNKLVSFGLSPMAAIETVFGKEAADETKEILKKIEDEDRNRNRPATS